jgi:UDP-N-acetylglucosamine acyltransferase
MNTLSFVHSGAKIGQNVEIGPFCYIEEDVIIGDGTVIGPHVTIFNGSRLGTHCRIYPGAVIGGPGQDLSYRGENTTVEIGNDVVIREHCTLHRGTTSKWKTTVGDGCYLMAYSHIAHDCVIGKKCILANAVNLGGHVEVGDMANIGGMVAVHQFCKIGRQVMVGGGAIVRKDVPPYIKAARDPVSYIGVNSIGLQRKGFSRDEINQITDIYRLLFVKHRNVNKAVAAIQIELPDSTYRREILEFVDQSNRGLIKGIN